MDNNFKIQLIATQALHDKYGFCPAPQQITLLESDDEGTYILFRIGEHEYHCDDWEIINLEDRKKSEDGISQYFHMFMEARKDLGIAEDRIKEKSARIAELVKKLNFREQDLTEATKKQEELETINKKQTKRINELRFEIHRMKDRIRKLEPIVTELIGITKED